MRIHIIDNASHIQPPLTEGDVRFYADEIQALNAVGVERPGLILLHFSVCGASTPGYIDLLLSRSSRSSVVVIGDELADDVVLSCLMAGAKGYQNGRQLNEYFIKIVKATTVGEAWISRRLTALLLDVIRQQKYLMLETLAASPLTLETSSLT